MHKSFVWVSLHFCHFSLPRYGQFRGSRRGRCCCCLSVPNSLVIIIILLLHSSPTSSPSLLSCDDAMQVWPHSCISIWFPRRWGDEKPKEEEERMSDDDDGDCGWMIQRFQKNHTKSPFPATAWLPVCSADRRTDRHTLEQQIDASRSLLGDNNIQIIFVDLV